MPSVRPFEPTQDGSLLSQGARRFLAPNKMRPPINPALLKHAEVRAAARQNR
jgi:hypothetical protein